MVYGGVCEWSVCTQSTQGLSECDLDLISFANELILLHDGYLQFPTISR